MFGLTPSLYRIPFLLLNIITGQLTTSPPTQYPGQRELRRYETNKKALEPLSVIEWWFLPSLWVFMYIFHISELYITLATAFPVIRSFTLLNVLLPSDSLITPMASLLHVTPALVIGSLLCFVASILRVTCYRTLGRQFTFALSLVKDHKLITNGPYSIIRHPAYLGSLTYFTGLLLSQFGSGSWWNVGGLWSTTFGKVAGMVWLSWVAFLLTSLVGRIPKEDKVMKEEFGKQWVEWSKKTRYRLIPGIY